MPHLPSRRFVLAVSALSAAAAGLSGCLFDGRRNDKPSDEGLLAIDALRAALSELPGVVEVEVSFVTKAMQAHVISGGVVLEPDLPATVLVDFGVGARAAALANQVDDYDTAVFARTTIRDHPLFWSFDVGVDASLIPATVDGALGELERGAGSVRINYGQHLGSEWSHIDESALLAATPAGIEQIARRLEADVLGGHTWVNVVMAAEQPAANFPYEQALEDLTPVLQSSTTTLTGDHFRWKIQFNVHVVDDAGLVSAMTKFLRTLRRAGVQADEIELDYPWHVILDIDGQVGVSSWVDGNSDREAAEPVVTALVAAANRD